MRIICLTAFYFLLLSCIRSQSIAWAKQVGGPGSESAQQITTDENGNSYVYCYTNIKKYDTFGNLLWTIQLNKININKIKANAQHLYVCGSIDTTATIGATQLTSGYRDAVLVRLTNAGNVDLVLKGTGAGLESFSSVDIDDAGNIYTTGTYDTLSFFGNDTLKGTARNNYFLIKYNSQGNIVWKSTGAQKSHSTGGGYISVTNDGSACYGVAFVEGADGSTLDSVDFNNSQIYFLPYTLGSYLITKYDASGNLLGVASMYSGNPVAGIDQDTLGNIFVACEGRYSHIGVYKYDASFNYLFYKWYSCGNEVWIAGMDVDKVGNIYLTGSFAHFMNFISDTLHNLSPYAGYIVKLDSQANYKWAIKLRKANFSYGNSGMGISSDGKGHVFVAGLFMDSVYIGSNSFFSFGQDDIFIAKINDDEQFAGVNELFLNEASDLSVFPNPTSGKFISHGKVSAVYDIYGRKINYSARLNEIDLSVQPKGIYFVELEVGEIKTVKKIVLE